ncbi:MAG: hypothetical protein ACYDH6_06130 [Acidimicrobiales bacterium]
MGSVVLLVIIALAVWQIASYLRRRGGIVPRRGMSVGADLGTLADQPRVRVRTVTPAGPERVQLVLAPELGDQPDLDVVVFLAEGEFGLDLLREWQGSQCLVALVMPSGSRLVRLRSVDDLQPLTLRRDDA